jgi:hypothetical protein
MSQSKFTIDALGTKLWRNSKGQLHREDGPAVESDKGHKQWWFNNCLHREDGPAVEWADGSQEWWINGLHHRLDGPAIEYPDNIKHWWVNGKEYSKYDFSEAIIMFLLNCNKEAAKIVLKILKN